MTKPLFIMIVLKINPKAQDGETMHEWQPIETAPKDTAILVYNASYSVAHFSTTYNRWIVYGAESECTKHLNMWQPEHWMPLPDSPENG